MAFQTVLLIEDNQFLRVSLKEKMEMQGYIVFPASIGSRAVNIARQHTVDLILLDLGLPDGSGLTFMQKIREYCDAPVIIISAEIDIKTKIECLDQGADDYLCKPFNADELTARIRAHLRRYSADKQSRNEQDTNINTAVKLQFGDCVLDRSRFAILNAHRMTFHLTPKEFHLLNSLITRSGQVLSRDELCHLMKKDNYTPTPRAIDVKITRLRQKIGDDGKQPAIIKTVRGVGYIVDGDITVLE